MRPYLLPFAWVYGGVVNLRNSAFDRGVFRTTDVGVPVISMGNISVGGTGKTPLTQEAARILIGEGHRTGILSRGYGRRSTGFRWVQQEQKRDLDASMCGDEPVQLAQSLPGAFVAVDENRVAGARRMIADAGVGVIVLDDGFQHRWIRRRLDLVVVTAEDMIGRNVLLPAGRRREPLSSLRRADFVVISGCYVPERCSQAAEKVRGYTNAKVVCMRLDITELRGVSDNSPLGAEDLSGKNVLAVSGIGNPSSFESALRRCGMNVGNHEAFVDHYAFTESDLNRIKRMVERTPYDAVVMTQKDATRIRSTRLRQAIRGMNMYYTVARPEWVTGAAEFSDSIRNAAASEG